MPILNGTKQNTVCMLLLVTLLERRTRICFQGNEDTSTHPPKDTPWLWNIHQRLTHHIAIVTSFNDLLTLQIYDYNEYRKDKELGSATFPLERIQEIHEYENEQLEVMANGKARGILATDLRFFPVLEGPGTYILFCFGTFSESRALETCVFTSSYDSCENLCQYDEQFSLMERRALRQNRTQALHVSQLSKRRTWMDLAVSWGS